uniref:Uncharacterized protein n=1 Tax=Anguilla anguilla TaxID=7936 RepID=A0A0E9XKF7_ANGAN
MRASAPANTNHENFLRRNELLDKNIFQDCMMFGFCGSSRSVA